MIEWNDRRKADHMRPSPTGQVRQRVVAPVANAIFGHVVKNKTMSVRQAELEQKYNGMTPGPYVSRITSARGARKAKKIARKMGKLPPKGQSRPQNSGTSSSSSTASSEPKSILWD